MHTHRRRFGAVTAVLSLLASLVVVLIGGAAPAGADTAQNFGCLGVTGTFSTFPVPITGLTSPNPVTLGGSTTLGGSGITVQVTSALIVAGVNTGLVQAAPTLADVGTAGGLNGTTKGENAVVVSLPTATDGVHLTIDAPNTSQASQTAVNTAATSFTFYATNDGTTIHFYQGTPNPPTNTNLTEVTAIPVSVALGDTTWTPTANPAVLATHKSVPSSLTAPTGADKAAAPLQIYSKINGAVTVNFYCWPGAASADGLSLVPLGAATAASSIDSVTVLIPPTAPVCNDFSTTAPAAQSITIDLNTKCSDVNGNIDTATFAPSATTNGGTLTPIAGQPGKYTYLAPATDPGVPDTFTFSVQDTLDRTEGPFTSNTATASISILGNLCDATGTSAYTVPISPTLGINEAYAPTSCSLRQTLAVPVLNSTRTLEQTGSSITMVSASSIAGPDGIPGTADDTIASAAPIVLNGQPQLAVGSLNQLTVTNARGDDAGWTVTGQVTPFLDQLHPLAPCVASVPASWNNHCIPGDNLGWIPSSAIAHTVIPGDVAQVTSGATLFSPGFFSNVSVAGGITGLATGLGSSAQTLCSSPATHSGGTFSCGASLGLSVPASSAAGVYGAVLTLTLA
jgi:hypothetical protein